MSSRILAVLGLCLLFAISYVPQSHASSDLVEEPEVIECIASWYGPGFHGRTMANGDTFDMNDPTTIANKEFEYGTLVLITNTENGKSILAFVRDYGPHVDGRCVDVSKAAGIELGLIHNGTAEVRVTVIMRA